MAGVALFHNSTYVAIDESTLNTAPGELERPQMPWFLPGSMVEPNRCWIQSILKLVECLYNLLKCEIDVLDIFAETKS